MYIVRKKDMAQNKSCQKEFILPADLQEASGIGMAVDLGTTTIAVSFYDLATGRYLGSSQQKNRQTQLGSDVIMRLMHCQQGREAQLQEMVVSQLESMAENFLRQEQSRNRVQSEKLSQISGEKPSQSRRERPASEQKSTEYRMKLQKITVAGNTTMCHILAGQDITGLTGSPFSPAYQGTYRCMGSALGMRQFGETRVEILAGIGSHVGADTTAMLLDLDWPVPDTTALAVDIGTNAEIVLNDHGTLTACSVPAGPAFEGAQISCGMRGGNGAISKVKWAAGTGNMLLDVLWDGEGQNEKPIPRGICGSGLVDAAAQFLAAGKLQADGYIPSEEGQLVLYEDAKCRLTLTQQDIRQFQLAKASVQAGIKVLLSTKGLSLDQIDTIYIAGVFGGHISEKSAVQTGLFPKLTTGRIVQIGNAAGRGAAKALLSESVVRQAERTAAGCKHVELAETEQFQQYFMDAMALKIWTE